MKNTINYLFKISLLILLSPLLLMACSSVTPPTHYYLLSQDLGPTAEVRSTQSSVYLETVTLTDYLNQPALVMLADDQQAHVANYHFWGERLDKAVSRVITYDLEHACQCRVLDKQLADEQPRNAAVLSIHIEQMASNLGGSVILAGRYRLTQNQEQKIHRFHYQETMAGTGFKSAVATKRRLVKQLASNVNQQLTTP